MHFLRQMQRFLFHDLIVLDHVDGDAVIDKTTVRIKVDSDPEDDENFIVTGLECPNYGIKVTP